MIVLYGRIMVQIWRNQHSNELRRTDVMPCPPDFKQLAAQAETHSSTTQQ